jgi:DNA-directed RNA polymerase subunit RPC12/RpoP
MAKHDEEPTSEERVETVIRQQDGSELRIGFTTREYEDGDNERTEKITEYAETPEGHMWGPHFLMKEGQRGALVVCAECRRQARSRLHRHRSQMVWTPLASAQRCHSCGRYFCSVHYTLSSDQRIRCRRCNRRHFLFHHMLKPLFFKEV